MKRMFILAGALLFSVQCFAAYDTNNINSAVKDAFYTNSTNSPHSSVVVYGGKDISRPKMAVVDDRTALIQPKIIG